MSGSFKDAFDAYTSGGPFEGFAAADFEAYQPKKWSSNAYTLARRKAKDKLLALGHAVSKRIKDQLGGRELHGSDEAPTVANGKKVEAQWAFFMRDGSTRSKLKPLLGGTDLSSGNLFDIALHQQHACLALRLDEAGFAIGFLAMPTAKIDRDNIAHKLAEAEHQRSLMGLLKELPAGAQVVLGAKKMALAEVSEATIASWAAELESGEQRFQIEQFFDRSDAELSNEDFVEQAANVLLQFVPLADFLAWSETNDFAGLREALEKTVKEKTKAVAERFKKGDRVTIMSGFFAGQGGFLLEIDPGSGKAKIAVGPASLSVDVKDLKPA